MSGAQTPAFTIGPAPGPPPTDLDLLRDNAALLAMAETALAKRRAAYPALVEKQALSPADAAADIGAWELLVGEYQWICSRAGESGACPPSWTRHDRIDAVNLAMDRTERVLTSNPGDPDLLHQRDLYRALNWHLTDQSRGTQHSHWLASLNHQLRARANAPLTANPLCSACDRRAEDPATQACTRTDCGLGQRKEAA